MSTQDTPLGQKLQSYGQSLSPQSKRNTKNLSLQLNKPNQNNEPPPVQSPIAANRNSISPRGVRLYRHPTISSGSHPNTQSSAPSNQQNGGFGLKRRTTLSLSIPTEAEVAKNSGSAKLSSNSIPSFASSVSTSSGNPSLSSPILSSPLIPSTPKELHYSQIASNFSNTTRSSQSSNSTLQNVPLNNTNYNNSVSNIANGDMKTQTLIHNLSNIEISGDGDNSKLNAYPNGPQCVLEPSLFLYSEPKLEDLASYDLVINVAKELIPPLPFAEPLSKTSITKIPHETIEYYYVPWTHTSKMCQDLPFLTDRILQYLSTPSKRILVHCQCGVSRSASLIVALFMKMDHLNLNDAYNKLKESAPEISPNMSLIFQLMEWGEIIGVKPTSNGNGGCYNGYNYGLSPQYEIVQSPMGLVHNDKTLNEERGDDGVIIHNDPYLASYD